MPVTELLPEMFASTSMSTVLIEIPPAADTATADLVVVLEPVAVESAPPIARAKTSGFALAENETVPAVAVTFELSM